MKGRDFVNAPPPTSPGHRWIYGVHAVTEWLRARPAQVHSVRCERHSAARHAPLLNLAAARHVRVELSDQEALTRVAGTPHHQGVIADTVPFPYAELVDVLQRTPRLLVVGDQIQDPHNLGAVLRTAEAVGAGGLIVPKDGSVPVTPVVEASAAGAAARVAVCRVTNIARTLETLKQHGYWSIGLVPKGGVDLYDLDVPERAVVVIGGEAGMRPLVAKRCDFAVSIPMFGQIESLNASVAAAIVLYELVRKWGRAAGTPRGTPNGAEKEGASSP